MTRILALLAALALTAAPATADEARTVILKERLTTLDGVITLGDLFEGAGEAADVTLARAPAPVSACRWTRPSSAPKPPAMACTGPMRAG